MRLSLNINKESLAKKITEATSGPFAILSSSSISGGCINTAYQIESDEKSYFVKFNSVDKLSMFEAESDGLLELAKAKAIRVPQPICTGVIEQQSYIVMEYINLNGMGSMAELAEQLAALHHCTAENNEFGQKIYGWQRENTIGSTLQENTQVGSWQTFWVSNALVFN